MTNPLARAVMKNIVGSSNVSEREETRKRQNVKSLDELAKGIKGEVVEVEEEAKDQPNLERDRVAKTMSFSDIAKKAKEEPVKTREYKVGSRDERARTQNLSDLARSIKGGEVSRNSKKESSEKESKSLKFNDLLNNNRNINNNKSNNRIEDKHKVEDYVDSKDRNLISSLIDGNKKADETDVKSAKVLNLSQAVKSMISR